MSGALRLETKVNEWRICADAFAWRETRADGKEKYSIMVYCERPDEAGTEQRTSSRRVWATQEEARALMQDLFDKACMGLSGACAIQAEKEEKAP